MPENMNLPARITDEATLDDLLAQPSPALIEMMTRLDGDITVLGVAGKMGISLAVAAVRASKKAGVKKRVLGVARFSAPAAREQLDAAGVETVACDLLDPQAVSQLEPTPNVIYMAGRKFGTSGGEALTWAVNTLAPGVVARHFHKSKIVVFSTGCVYPLVSVASGGSREEDAPDPVGEYAWSSLGRERNFMYFNQTAGLPICIFRLNYAVDLRYGVLHDIAAAIANDEPVDDTVPGFNIIWQADANNQALLCLEHCDTPATIMNCTGREILNTREVAEQIGTIMQKEVRFTNTIGEVGYLNNASKATALFGTPTVSSAQMLDWTARWVQAGGRSLGKPTHFEVNTGKF